MKTILIPVYLLVGVLALGGLVAAFAQTRIKEVPVRATRSLDGAELFQEYCAVCHGVDGKGNGPAADALKKRPGDLTQLTRKNGGRFPALAVQTTVKGSGDIVEHGTAAMPMWGHAFSHPGQSKDFVEMRLFALMKYVEQIQAK